MNVGTVAALRRYPVKSLRGESLEAVAIARGGLAGDRARALVVREGHARAGKTYRGKENDRLHLTAAAGEAQLLAQRSGVSAEVVESDERFFDAAPVSLLVDRWLEGASAELGFAVEAGRFRANIEVAAGAAFALTEQDLVGSLLEIGEVRLRVASPIDRCVAVTYAPDGGGNQPHLLRYLAQQRDNKMGIYCTVEREGIVRLGDRIARI